MGDQIILFFNTILIQDYIVFFISIGFFICFIFIGIEKIYKAYLGIILGLFIFILINYTLSSLNTQDVGVNSLRDFFTTHKEGIGFYSILCIPILSILLPFNHNIAFRISQKKALNYFVIFLFGIFFFSFFLSIFLSIIHNRFLFNIDPKMVTQIKEGFLVKTVYTYLEPGVLFHFLTLYDYIINLFVIVFIIYKLTIGGVADFIISKTLKLLVHFFDEQSKGGEKNEKKGEEKEAPSEKHEPKKEAPDDKHGHDAHAGHH